MCVCSAGMYIATWAVARPLTQLDYMPSLQDIWKIVKYLQAFQSLGGESTVSLVRQSRTFGPVNVLTAVTLKPIPKKYQSQLFFSLSSGSHSPSLRKITQLLT